MHDQSAPSGLRWSLQITEDRRDGVVILELKGRVSSVSVGRLAERMAELMSRGDHRLVVDLGRVDYLSSAGLRALEAAADRCAAARGAFVLCAVGGPVQMVLTLAGLLPRFSIEPSQESAVLRAARSAS